MNKDYRNYYRDIYSSFQKRKEREWTPKINAALKEQTQQFLTAWQHTSKEHAIHAVTYFPLQKVLHELYIQVGVQWGAKVNAQVKRDALKLKRMPIGFSEMLIRLITEYFMENLLSDVQDITETSRKEIMKVLIKADELGWSHDETVANLSAPELTAARSRLIARTETVTSSNLAGDMAARATGLNLKKEWVAVDDSRTRNHHRDVDGVVLPIDDKFNVGGTLMLRPGDRGTTENRTPAKEVCNCRCVLVHIPI